MLSHCFLAGVEGFDGEPGEEFAGRLNAHGVCELNVSVRPFMPIAIAAALAVVQTA
jgi:hypothetical protein